MTIYCEDRHFDGNTAVEQAGVAARFAELFLAREEAVFELEMRFLVPEKLLRHVLISRTTLFVFALAYAKGLLVRSIFAV